MKRWALWLMIVFIMVGWSVPGAQGLEFGGDLLNGAGDFDDPDGGGLVGDRGIWTLWTNTGNAVSEFTQDYSHSANWSWRGGDASASAQQARIWLSSPLAAVADRSYQVSCTAGKGGSSPSYFRVKVGQGSEINLNLSWMPSWSSNSTAYTTAVDETELPLLFKFYSNSADDTVYLDDVVVARERCLPDPNYDSLSGVLPFQQRTTVSIIGNTSTGGTYRCAFDPDISVSGDGVVVHNVEWVSDSQVDVILTALIAGDVNLVLRNAYSDLEDSYTMRCDRPVGPFTLDSDDFPIIFWGMNNNDASFEEARSVGATYMCSWVLCPYDSTNEDIIANQTAFLDRAEQYGMRVLLYLRGHDWVGKADGVTRLQTIAGALKDHPAFGFWHFVDEPEIRSIPLSQVQLFYDMLKTVTPDVPVLNTHAQYKDGMGNDWWDYYGAEDVFATDRYPVQNQEFPDAAIDSASNWIAVARDGSPDPIIPSLQLHNRATFEYEPQDSRYPNCQEIRFWCFASIVQGVRGLGWYSYERSVNSGNYANVDAAWLSTYYKPVNHEVITFAYMTSPVHEPTIILDGGDGRYDGGGDDVPLYLAKWTRSTGTWVVLVNGYKTERDVDIDVSAHLEDGVLVPWGLTNDVTARIEGGRLKVHLQPWETMIWTRNLAADISGPGSQADGYVNTMDLTELASQWLDCTDPTDPGCE